MIEEAIILAGGMGTRLKSVITEMPKPMAPIGKRPFLEVLLNNLNEQGIQHVILSVGYKHEIISGHFGNNFKNIKLDYAIESEPLGTGGAVSLALKQLSNHSFLMMNGDTLFDVNLKEFCAFHDHHSSDLSIALKSVQNQDRYGLVEIDEKSKIIAFREKQFISKGLINGGIYATSTDFITSLSLPSKYSWEKEVLEKQTQSSKMFGYSSDSYFIDIGIPSDYAKAQVELEY